MKTIKVEYTKVFNNLIKTPQPIIVCVGGARSSKSYSIAQLFIKRLVEEENKNFLILRKTRPSLKLSTYKLFMDLLHKYEIFNRKNLNMSDLIYRHNTNYVVFTSIDDPEKIKCFHPQTEILTETGFEFVSKLHINQKVATYDYNTNRAYYKPITNLFQYDYNGFMLSPSRKKRIPYLDFCITPNHKLIGHKRVHNTVGYTQGTPEFVKAKDIPSRFYVPRTAEFNGDRCTTYRIPKANWNAIEGGKQNKNGQKTCAFSICNWLSFLGWYLSEGSLGGENGKFEIQISQRKEEGKVAIRKVLDSFPYTYHEKKDGFRLNGKDLFMYLKQFGKSHQKFIPRDVLNLHPKLLRYLFDALVAGDGYVHSTKRIDFGSTSKQLIDDMSELSLKLGMSPSLHQVDTKKWYPTALPFWVLSITKQHYSIIEKLKEVPYKGKVHCPEVPPYHTVLIRYNGRTMWIGQSTEWNYIWLEEANEFTYDDFIVLKLRLSGKTDTMNQMILSKNPVDELGWIHQRLEKEPDVSVITSTHKDNPFISDEYRKILYDLKDTDLTFYKIYTLGEYAQLSNLIYTNWDIIEQVPDSFDEVIYAIDFGFNNPNALLKIGIKDNEYYLSEQLYQTHMTNQDLIVELKDVIKPKTDVLYADSAEPARIEEISKAGFDVHPANKSVKDGIDYVKSQKLHIDKNSVNLISEIRTYKYKEDRNGNVLEDPVKFRDHLMDDVRYALYTHYLSIIPIKISIPSYYIPDLSHTPTRGYHL